MGLNNTTFFFYYLCYILLMNRRSIEDKVIKRATPSLKEREETRKIVDELKEKVNELALKFNLDVEPLLVGSVAKNTCLSKPDIDLFLVFPSKTSREDLEKYGLKIGKEVLKGEERYAEHPYIHGIYKGFEVDIVPCYRIEDAAQKMSAVDRTPFHTAYIIKNLRNEQRREVQLLKRFLKGIGIYGAEAEIQGFSGYLCELLILKYGTFESTIKNAVLWKGGHKIVLESRAKKTFNDALIVIDPVDPNRNVAAALSLESFCTFIYACKEFLANPEMEFFFPNEVSPLSQKEIIKRLKERGYLIGLVFKKPNVVDDVLYPQLQKCRKVICEFCERNDFKVHHSSFFVNSDVFLLIEFETSQLPILKKHYGPLIWHSNAPVFLEKWRSAKRAITEPYIEGSRWTVDIKRNYTHAKALIETEIENLNLGKNINPIVREKFELIENEDLVKKRYFRYLTIFLERKFLWEY